MRRLPGRGSTVGMVVGSSRLGPRPRPGQPGRRAAVGMVVGSSLLVLAPPAPAQPPPAPIGGYVVDVRGSFVPFGRNVELAAQRSLPPLDTPGPGVGIDVGAHAYPFRWWRITFGVGASYHASRAEQARGELSADPDGPPLRKRFTALSSQLSFNFGARNGWSYLSGGLGSSRLALFPRGAAEPAQASANTLNYGGGVRWFLNDRVGFTIDLRLYAISPLAGAPGAPGSPRLTQMTLNVGASFR